MIQSKSLGIQEAIRELKNMSLSKPLRIMFEARLKARRDRAAEDDYIREEGVKQGIEQGIEQSIKHMIQCDQKSGVLPDQTLENLMQYFQLTEERAKTYLKKWSIDSYH